MSKEAFLIYKEFYPAVESLSDLQLGRLFRALFLYQREGKECEDLEIKMAFLFFKNQFRIDNEKYEKIVKRNQDNGSRGGRPPKEEETQDNPENPVGYLGAKKPDNENENEKENVSIENIFESFRKLYPGTRKGRKVEFDNFKKRHKDFATQVHLLAPALEKMNKWRTQAKTAGKFVPEYKHLSTWINGRCWEEEYEVIGGTISDKSDAYSALKQKGWPNCSKDELEWAYDYQHRTEISYNDYPRTELLGNRGNFKTAADYDNE